MKYLSLLLFIFFSTQVFAGVRPDIYTEVFSSGYSSPVAVRNDGVNSRLYVVQRNGAIYIADSAGTKQATPFLDISGRVLSGGERGLLGMAFHPSFRENRLFVVNYTRRNDGATVIATFKASQNNSLQAEITSEKIILTIPQPYSNHNGGDIHFGSDGYLYIGMGDGGSSGDPQNYAQNPQSLLGKMLRIHLDTDTTYSIPLDNPFAESAMYRKEIWATGLRNPWRFSFDRLNDDLWIADVGQNAREEVNLAVSPRRGGENYGWRCYEGEVGYNTSGCGQTSEYTAPIFTYNRTNTTGGQSITGGYVYRGSLFPDLYGYYVCADYISGNFWLIKQNGAAPEVILKNNVQASVTGFGEDIHGEIYLTSFDGRVYRLGSRCSGMVPDSIYVLPVSCDAATDGELSIAFTDTSSPVEYRWSNGSTSSRITGLSAGWYHLEATAENGCVFKDSFLIETVPFERPVIERRADSLTTQSEGTYEWYLNNELLENENNHYILPVRSGLYTVEVTDESGCQLTSAPAEFIISNTGNRMLKEGLLVYPNPTDGLVHIQLPKPYTDKNMMLIIYDELGKALYQQVVWSSVEPVSMSQFAKGVYIVEVLDKESDYRAVVRIVRN